MHFVQIHYVLQEDDKDDNQRVYLGPHISLQMIFELGTRLGVLYI